MSSARMNLIVNTCWKIQGVFDTFILPIAGTDYPKYIACFSLLAEKGIKPKLIYCASAGCQISYMAMMSSFTTAVENWSISSSMFVKKATPITPRLMTYLMNGHFYKRADVTPYVSQLFVPCKLQDVEIVTGYYAMSDNAEGDLNRQAIVISTNQTKENSALKDVKPSLTCIEMSFATDSPVSSSPDQQDAHRDAMMVRAINSIKYTTNIPILLEPLDNIAALDFGIVAPNPQSIINGPMKKTIYFSPIDIDYKEKTGTYSVVFHNSILKDIAAVCNRFDNHKNFKTLDEVLVKISSLNDSSGTPVHRHNMSMDYCLVMYSTNTVRMEIDNFTDRMSKHFVAISKTCIKYRLSY